MKPFTLRSVSAPALLAATLLVGCAGLRSVSNEVSSFGEWPAQRQPGTYAFDRLPSQEAQPQRTEELETSARVALQKAGFKAVDPGKEPDVLVQVGAATSRTDFQPWDDPLWWRGGFGYWRYGPWVSPRWGVGARFDAPFGYPYGRSPRYERQVALLIRDRATGKPLFETRASNDGYTRADDEMLGVLFQAALTDFPRLGVNPRRVVVALPASP